MPVVGGQGCRWTGMSVTGTSLDGDRDSADRGVGERGQGRRWTGVKQGAGPGSGGRACRDRGRRTRFSLGYATRGPGVQAGAGRPDVIMPGTARRNGAVSSPVVSLPNQVLPGGPSAHMVVCGDDGLAHRLAAELRGVYGEQVTLVVPPSGRQVRQPVVGRARAASAALLDRVVNATVNR